MARVNRGAEGIFSAEKFKRFGSLKTIPPSKIPGGHTLTSAAVVQLEEIDFRGTNGNMGEVEDWVGSLLFFLAFSRFNRQLAFISLYLHQIPTYLVQYGFPLVVKT